ncbi:MAG: glycosyltransferase family 9 protein [Gammaproteobacteria bacterium]
MIEFKQSPKSLCIFRLSAIGDVTHILPVIHTLKKVWPETEITWVIGQVEYELVKTLSGVEFIRFNKADGWRAFVDLRRQLKGRQFEVLLMIQAALRASIASLFISARYKIGFDRQRAVDFQWLFSNYRISGDHRVHVLDGFFQFLQTLGIEEKTYAWDLPINESDKRYATEIHNGKRCAVINPCSSARSSNWRNWARDRYAEIADYLHSRGLQVLITGGPSSAEHDYCQSIVDRCQSSPKNLAGQTSLGQLLALIEGAEFVIAPDTGPAHMATIVDTPVIGLFASSNPARTGPYKSQDILVNYYEQALLKHNHRTLEQASWGERVRHPDVMELISLEAVKQAIDRLLA